MVSFMGNLYNCPRTKLIILEKMRLNGDAISVGSTDNSNSD